jgi:formimidoylglutamate deiminase
MNGDLISPGKLAKQSIFCQRLLTASGWARDLIIRIDSGGLIAGLEEGKPESADLALSGPVITGMPNCHSHAFQRQMAGLAGLPGARGSDSFWTWRERMYRLAHSLDSDAIEAIALWLYVEMLEAGYTSCAEFHYLHHQPDGQEYKQVDEIGRRLLSAASKAGIALTLLPVLYCRAGFDQDVVLPHQLRFANQPEQFLSIFESSLEQVRNHPNHRVGLALHSLRAVSRDQMDRVLDAEAGRAATLHIHIAEQAAEVEQCLKINGMRPVQWLLEHASVDARWCLVHATHMNRQEYDDVARSGAVIGLCPTTEADLGDGFFEAEHWQELGGRMAVGSDSNLRISPREELRLLEFGMRLRTGRRNVLASKGMSCGSALYSSAAEGGGIALGQPVGRIAEGYRADFVELDATNTLLRGVSDDEILDRYVFAGDRGMIASVFVAGQQLVRNGIHEFRDAAAAGFAAVMEEMTQ